MIRIHREGRAIVIMSSLILLGINILAVLYFNYIVYYTVSFISIALIILIFRFFRIPFRRFVKDDRLIIAPADGKVVVIEKTFEKEYLKENRVQISIFMSLHDVHINYFPINGTIEYSMYHPGKYLLARLPKSSELNERHSTVIKNRDASILVRQIAGFVARRIKCYAQTGKRADQGKELGFIKFGSRLDIFIPEEYEILVKLNQTVTGGVTPLALIK